MDVRQLRCFESVLATGSMTRAAEVLGYSQPTVSVVIARLEREVGFALFRRSRGRLEPTPEAFHLHEVTAAALGGVERVVQTAREIRETRRGDVTVISYPGIAWNFLPRLVGEFRSLRQDVRVRLVSRSSASLRQMLPGQVFDLAVVEVPAPYLGPTVQTFRFTCDCAMPAGHPLAQRDVITAQDLDGHPVVTLFEDHATTHQVSRAFSEVGASLNVVFQCEFFASACNYLHFERAVTLVDPITASEIPKSNLVLRPFEPQIHYEIAVLRPPNQAESRVTRAFRELLEERLASLLTA